MSFSTESFALPALDRVSTTAEIPVGTRAKGTDNSEWVYVQAAGVIDQYDAVAIDFSGLTGQAVALTATNAVTSSVIGVVDKAFADNEYGFVQVRGVATVNVAAAAADGVQLYATATEGTLDDAGTVTVQGIVLTSAESGGTASAHIGAASAL